MASSGHGPATRKRIGVGTPSAQIPHRTSHPRTISARKPLVRYQILVGRLHFAIEAYLRSCPGIGQVFLSPLDVVLSYYDVVEPDLLFVESDRQDILTTKNLRGAPSLVIEVLSRHTKSRDRRLKRDLCERTGVREYWLVDPEKSAVSTYRQHDAARFGAVMVLERARVLETPLRGFSLPLAELFA